MRVLEVAEPVVKQPIHQLELHLDTRDGSDLRYANIIINELFMEEVTYQLLVEEER